MATRVSSFLRQLTRGMAAEALGDLSDPQLVEQVLAGRAEPAFETIVRRHGPMVYRVAWRVLLDDQEVEDAFQATFLLLAQKVRALRKHASLASWLHGVAHRVALKAKARAAARRRHEQRVARSPVGAGHMPWEELSRVLDTELASLPDQWRLPLVLCYLEGRTQDEAAGQLGWSKNTLRRRLEDARAALGRRLDRQGVGPAALAALLLADCTASAALPSALLAAAVNGAAQISAGRDIAAVASAKVAALTEGVRTTVALTSRIATTLAAGLLLLIGGAGVSLDGATAQSPPVREGRGPDEHVEDRRPQELAKIIPDKIDPLKNSRLAGGRWVMSLPAGFKHSVELRPLGGERYALEKAVRFSGVYALRDDRLVLVEPLGAEDAGFAWQLKDTEELTLVGQPPVARTGQNYLGATLRRLVGAGGEWGTAVNGVRGLVETKNEELRFANGAPVWIVCRTKNFGNETPRVFHGRRHWFQLKVVDADGKAVPHSPEGVKELLAAVDETAIKKLPPGAEVTETYQLDRLFDLSRPGQYKVSFGHAVHFQDKEQPVAITSNVLMIAIQGRGPAPAIPPPAPPRPARNQQPRVAPAAANRGADRLSVADEQAAAGTLQRIRVDYRLTKEPAYRAPVQYCLVLLGSATPTPIWLASDGVTLYVDRNGNGDLTDPGEAVPFKKEGFAAFFADAFPGKDGVRHTHLHFAVRQRDWDNNKGGYWAIRADVAGRYPMYAFAHKFAKKPEAAPVIHLGGPLRMELEQLEGGRFVPGKEAELSAHLFCQYPGTEKAFVDVDHRCPKDIHPIAEIVFPPKAPGVEAVRLRIPLTQRC